MKKATNYVIIVLIVLATLGVGYFGYTLYPKFNKCPEITTDTIFKYDTIVHYIPDSIPYYVVKRDTIIYRDTVFKDVDTAEILKDYFALHHYTRTWGDSLLFATLKDEVSENKFVKSDFSYRILRPQTIINNVTTTFSFSRYLIVGADVPIRDIKYLNLDLMFVSPKWYGGIGYNAKLNSPTVKGGITIKKFK